MKKIIILLFLFTISHSYASEIKFEKIFDDLNKPWSLSFINQESIIYTEKSGKLFSFDLKNKKRSEIKHNLFVLEDGQGGLLDVLYHEEEIYISFK